MSIYPSLEDMKASELIKAQVDALRPAAQHQLHQQAVAYQPSAPGHYPTLPGQQQSAAGNEAALVKANYPRLHEFMGLELTEEMIRVNMPEYLQDSAAMVAVAPNNTAVAATNTNKMITPISGRLPGHVTHGVRSIKLIKQSQSSKLGLRVRAMQTGVFVCLVIDGSPAAGAGLRFGDQLLQIDGVDMAGMDVKKVHSILKGVGAGAVELIVRDRPFERTVTLIRDSTRHIGFQFKNGRIINIVKDSSAARNGLLTEHALLEVNGKNVIGLKDKEITGIISGLEGNALTVTVMPSFLYQHMVKEMDKSLFGKMDHSEEDF